MNGVVANQDAAITKKPICLAPFIGFVVDTNKGVRPCCTFEGDYLGNLKDNSINDILAQKEWQNLKSAHLNQKWPSGCLNCKEREFLTGWSLRQLFFRRWKGL